MNYTKFITANITSFDAGHRGGSIKIDVTSLFPYINGAMMGAFQNYLGDGMAGSICGGASFFPEDLKAKDQKKFFELKEQIKKFYYSEINGDDDGYEGQQSLPASAY